MKIIFVCFLFGLGTAGGQSRGCVIYKAGETIPAIPKGARYDRTCHSVINDTNKYCVEWDCPKTDCSYPIKPNSGCPYCRDTCVDGGKVYQKGASWKCDDGCNRCSCRPPVVSTMMMCYDKTPPKECMATIG
ncbi:kielin/chordin-like protein [Mytilus galloprovincialis]|uniref:kielin/chordin-like protein n=1 Tax=Mytilus galloprovincialis TaxID=29158 RepID=UPI003F7BBE13